MRPHPAAVVVDGPYKWVALSNTTLAVFMAALDGSIVIISLLAGIISLLRGERYVHSG
jgi:hypothetical protein